MLMMFRNVFFEVCSLNDAVRNEGKNSTRKIDNGKCKIITTEKINGYRFLQLCIIE